MSTCPRSYLVDGPLMGAADRRAAVKSRMVLALMAANAFDSRDSARRALYAQDFFALDIELLVNEAITEAADFAALTDRIAKLIAAS